MTRRWVKNVCGKEVEMTAEEIAAQQAEEAAHEAAKPLQEWQARIAATDAKVTARIIEDIVDALQQASIPVPETVTSVMGERKAIRQQKPKG